MLYGEAGDDLYVIGLNDSAIDTVFDHEGANRLMLNDITDQTVEASILGDDLYVTVDQAPVALVSDYVGHENALAGIDFGQGLRPIETLLTDHQDLAGAVNDAEQRAAEAAGDDLLSAHLHLTRADHHRRSLFERADHRRRSALRSTAGWRRRRRLASPAVTTARTCCSARVAMTSWRAAMDRTSCAAAPATIAISSRRARARHRQDPRCRRAEPGGAQGL